MARLPSASAAATGVAVFIGGAALLGLEIASSRVLAPYFGNSLFVWGALIGVVLAGLSLGYWLGGIVADRRPTPGLLVGVLVLASVLVAAIPFVDGWALDSVVGWNPGPRLNPLVATIVLFGVPSVVLGGVSPIAVRLRARSLESLGRVAGRLFAVSTAGSIAGTFATAFWLIPELGTDQLLAAAAVALTVAAAAVAAAERLALALALAVVLGVGGTVAVVALEPESGGRLAGSQLRNWSPVYRLRSEGTAQGSALDGGSGGVDVLYSKDTRYHRVVVAEDGESRYLRFDNSFQSGMYKRDPYETRFTYTDYLQLGAAYNAGSQRFLFVGLGAGSAPKRVWRDFPAARVDVVELDPEVVEVAHRFFGLPRDPRLRIDVEDGRRYLARTEERWDVIVVDAYYSDSIPFHLTTREFLELARSRLRPGGVVVANVIGAVSGSSSRLLRSMLRTYRSVFPTVAVHPVYSGPVAPEDVNNVIFVATDGAAPAKPFLRERWAGVRRRSPGAPDLKKAIDQRHEAPIRTADVPVLTDDYAPTDSLLLLFG